MEMINDHMNDGTSLHIFLSLILNRSRVFSNLASSNNCLENNAKLKRFWASEHLQQFFVDQKEKRK